MALTVCICIVFHYSGDYHIAYLGLFPAHVAHGALVLFFLGRLISLRRGATADMPSRSFFVSMCPVMFLALMMIPDGFDLFGKGRRCLAGGNYGLGRFLLFSLSFSSLLHICLSPFLSFSPRLSTQPHTISHDYRFSLSLSQFLGIASF